MVRYARFGLPLTAMVVAISFGANLLKRWYSVIEKHPDTSQIRLKQLSRSAVIPYERHKTYKQRPSSISTNEKRKTQSKRKILKRKRHKLTSLAPNNIIPNHRGQR